MERVLLEEWKQIDGYENYEVSNIGRVRSKDRIVYRKNVKTLLKGKILKQFTGGGYMRVALYQGDRKSRKQFAVHRLVASAFVKNPNPTELIFVNHKDENKFNNVSSNLEWCTCEYNANYGTSIERRVKHQDWEAIADKQSKIVLQYDLDMNLLKEWKSTAECGRNGYNSASVSKCCNGHLKTYKKYIWRYK